MRRALQLAARGRGRTSPNPMVGADHHRCRRHHRRRRLASASGHASRRDSRAWPAPATERAARRWCARSSRAAITAGPGPAPTRSSPPASHEWWRPSRIRIQRSRVRASRDCVPMASRCLRCGARGRTGLNAAFFMTMREGRPWVIAKAGVSADGRVAAGAGVRTAITSAAVAPARAAPAGRGRRDCRGIETVLVDDPVLTVREVFRPRPLTRVSSIVACAPVDRQAVVDPRCRSRRGLDDGGGPAGTRRHGPPPHRGRRNSGRRPMDPGGGAAGPGRTGLHSVLVEGGPRVHAAFAEAGMIDEVQLFVAQDVFLPDGLPVAPLAG